MGGVQGYVTRGHTERIGGLEPTLESNKVILCDIMTVYNGPENPRYSSL